MLSCELNKINRTPACDCFCIYIVPIADFEDKIWSRILQNLPSVVSLSGEHSSWPGTYIWPGGHFWYVWTWWQQIMITPTSGTAYFPSGKSAHGSLMIHVRTYQMENMLFQMLVWSWFVVIMFIHIKNALQVKYMYQVKRNVLHSKILRKVNFVKSCFRFYLQNQQ